MQEQDDSTAMVLSTVDAEGRPDSRMVLLKGLESDAFVFYTNYNSPKSLEIQATPTVCLNFYWPKMVRQVRIRGLVHRVSDQQSDAYFSSRPRLSQLSAIASSQSSVIENREILEQRWHALEQLYRDKPIPRPTFWGGFAVTPWEMEFWQGRSNRLHDRIRYTRTGDRWHMCRLAP